MGKILLKRFRTDTFGAVCDDVEQFETVWDSMGQITFEQFEIFSDGLVDGPRPSQNIIPGRA